MAKKTDAASPPAGLTRTFALAVPIADDDGRTWSEITLREPELRDQASMQRGKTTTANERSARHIAELSGVPDIAVRRLKLRDARVIQAWLKSLNTEAMKHAPVEMGDGSHTFELLAPVTTNAGAVTHITLREPDIDTGIAVEKAGGDTVAQATAAMIAALSDISVPVAMRLSVRDVTVMETWLGFFSPPGEDEAAA